MTTLIHQLIGSNSAVRACYHTRSNGRKLPIESRGTKTCGSSFYNNGFFLEKVGQVGWLFTSYTLMQGHHLLNFAVVISHDGSLLQHGWANIFGKGLETLMHDDQGQEYIDRHLNALIQLREANLFEWDEVN